MIQEFQKFGNITEEPKKIDPRDKIYAIKKGVVYAGLHYNPLTDSYLYRIYEPKLNITLKKVIDEFPLYLQIHYTGEKLDMNFINMMLSKYLKYTYTYLSGRERQIVLYYVERNMFHYEEITPLLEDDYIEDISMTGVRKPIYVYHRLVGSIPTTIYFKNEEEANHYIYKFAEKCNRSISFRSPILDATLPEGHRLNMTLGSEVTTHGPTFSIRRYKTVPITILDMVHSGMLSYSVLGYLWMLVEFHRSIMVIGPTASGKTTLLDALLTFIKKDDKIFSIEDTHELFIDHRNWVGTITRTGIGISTGSGRQMGEVDQMDLLKASLRQRPDYLIVGEARGEETRILFQAMATGHTSFTTFHASDLFSLISRIENDPIGLDKSNLTILSDIIIMQSYVENKREVRRIREIDEISGYDPVSKQLIFTEAVKYNPDKQGEDAFTIDYTSPSAKEIAIRIGQSGLMKNLELFRNEVYRRGRYLAAIDSLFKGSLSKSDIRKLVLVYHLLHDVEEEKFSEKLRELARYLKVV